MGALTASERRVARVLLANYPFSGLQTASEFARQAGVSTPTVLRFIGRIGFASYSTFRARLRDELEAQLKSPLGRHTAPGRSPRAAHGFAEAVRDNIRETFRHAPAEEIEAIAARLADQRQSIHLIGGRFTDALALYMGAHLRILRPKVDHLSGQEANWRDQLIDMGRKDVLVIFDIRRYQEDLYRLAEAAAARQVTVVLFTDQWLSPIARIAAHVLPARIEVPSPWDSSTALMALVEALLANVTGRSAQRSERRMRAIEQLRGDDGAER